MQARAGLRLDDGGIWRARHGNTENTIDDDPRFIANLTVWESVETLEAFVWQTVHRQFYERGAEWFEPSGEPHFVMWWVPEGHRPTLAEGQERLAHLRRHCESEHAFGWRTAPGAKLWRSRTCEGHAA